MTDLLMQLAIGVRSRKEKQNWEKKQSSNNETFYMQDTPNGKRYFHGSESYIKSLRVAVFKATGNWGKLSHIDNIEQLKFDPVNKVNGVYDKSPNVLCVNVNDNIVADIPAVVKAEKKGSMKA